LCNPDQIIIEIVLEIERSFVALTLAGWMRRNFTI
jgi:hypothetical protein